VSVERNKALVRRLLERIRDTGTWDQAVLDEFFMPTYRRHLTPTTPPLTAQEQRERAARLRAAFPDAHVTLEDIVAEGNRVAYRLTIRGTHQGTFLGVAPTQRRVTVSFTAIVRIEEGKLAEEWGGLDQIDLLRQLGATVSVGKS
jgi:predicted ester cyclase